MSLGAVTRLWSSAEQPDSCYPNRRGRCSTSGCSIRAGHMRGKFPLHFVHSETLLAFLAVRRQGEVESRRLATVLKTAHEAAPTRVGIRRRKHGGWQGQWDNAAGDPAL